MRWSERPLSTKVLEKCGFTFQEEFTHPEDVGVATSKA